MNRTQNGGSVAVRTPEAVSRRSYWNEFEQMRRQMDDIFGSFLGYSPLPRPAHSPGLAHDSDLSPDVYETQEELIFVAPIPGIEPGDLDIEATADTLSIRGERKPFFQQENAAQLRQSWWSARQGNFHFTFTLPVEVNPEKVQAHYRNGVLELHLPKAEAARPKSIKVNVNGTNANNPSDINVTNANSGNVNNTTSGNVNAK